jgi:hypothetical protein
MIHVAKFLYLSIFPISSARFIRFYDYLSLYVAACFILFMSQILIVSVAYISSCSGN